jgi:hypothetical protein
VENLYIYGDWCKACWHFKIKLSWLTSLLNLVKKSIKKTIFVHVQHFLLRNKI